MERRRFKRKPANARTMVKSRWQIADAICLDASMGGFRIQSHHEFTVGDEVEIALELPGGARLNCEGEVVREVAAQSSVAKGRVYGIRIVKIDPDTKGKLEKWIGKLTDAPAGGAGAGPRAGTAAPSAPGGASGRAQATGKVAGTGGEVSSPSLKLQRILMRLRPKKKKDR